MFGGRAPEHRIIFRCARHAAIGSFEFEAIGVSSPPDLVQIRGAGRLDGARAMVKEGEIDADCPNSASVHPDVVLRVFHVSRIVLFVEPSNLVRDGLADQKATEIRMRTFGYAQIVYRSVARRSDFILCLH